MPRCPPTHGLRMGSNKFQINKVENDRTKKDSCKPFKLSDTDRATKRTSSTLAAHHREIHSDAGGREGRQRRVWKACDRCRMKKAKV